MELINSISYYFIIVVCVVIALLSGRVLFREFTSYILLGSELTDKEAFYSAVMKNGLAFCASVIIATAAVLRLAGAY